MGLYARSAYTSFTLTLRYTLQPNRNALITYVVGLPNGGLVPIAVLYWGD